MERVSENLEGLGFEESLGSTPNSDQLNNKEDIDNAINTSCAAGKQPEEILPETAWIEILTCFKNTKADVINLCNVSPYLERVLLTRVMKKSKFDLLFGEICPMLLSKKYIDDEDLNSWLKAKNLKWHNLWKNDTVSLTHHGNEILIAPSTPADVMAFGEATEELEMDPSWHTTRLAFYNRGDKNYWKSVWKFMNNYWNRYPWIKILLSEYEMPRPYRREHVKQFDYRADYTMFLKSLEMKELFVNVTYVGQPPENIMSNSRTLKGATTGPDDKILLSYRTDFLHAEDDFLAVVCNKIDDLTIDPPPTGIPNRILLFHRSFEKLNTVALRMLPLHLQQFCDALPDLSDRNDLNIEKLWLPYQPLFHHGTYVRLCNKFGSVSKLTISTLIEAYLAEDPVPAEGDAEMEGLRNEGIVEVKFLIYTGDWIPHINHIQTFLRGLVNVKEITIHLVALEAEDLIEFVTGKENDFWDFLPNGKVVNFTNLPMYPRNPKYEGVKYELFGRDGIEFNTKMTRYSDIYYSS